jgi:DNA polymerase III alpha subunit
MAFAELSDYSGNAEIIMYPLIYQEFSSIIKNEKIYLIKGKIENDKIIAGRVFIFQELIH